jgi:hypothetical protein
VLLIVIIIATVRRVQLHHNNLVSIVWANNITIYPNAAWRKFIEPIFNERQQLLPASV